MLYWKPTRPITYLPESCRSTTIKAFYTLLRSFQRNIAPLNAITRYMTKSYSQLFDASKNGDPNWKGRRPQLRLLLITETWSTSQQLSCSTVDKRDGLNSCPD